MTRPAGALVLLLAAPMASGEELRVGMDTRTPPWSFVPRVDYAGDDMARDPKPTEAQLARLEGIDVDVAKALAERLGATLRIVPVAWFAMEQALLSKRFDLIVGAWTPSPRTPAGIVATTSYYEWGLLVAVRAEDKRIRAYRDLEGSVVGHYSDPVAERTLASLGARALRPYDAQELLFDDLKAGALDAVLFDSPYVRWRVGRDASFRAVGEPLNRLGYHVGVRREDAALLERVEAAVKDLASRGALQQIRRKWEGGR